MEESALCISPNPPRGRRGNTISLSRPACRSEPAAAKAEYTLPTRTCHVVANVRVPEALVPHRGGNVPTAGSTRGRCEPVDNARRVEFSKLFVDAAKRVPTPPVREESMVVTL